MVSIHAPPNRKERLLDVGNTLGIDRVSIHAPPNRKERQAPTATDYNALRFNPRPSQPEGATWVNLSSGVELCVSIHAPPNRKERPGPLPDPPLLHKVSIHAPPNRKERRMPLITTSRFRRFQSTPLPTGRSDALAKQVEALQA